MEADGLDPWKTTGLPLETGGSDHFHASESGPCAYQQLFQSHCFGTTLPVVPAPGIQGASSGRDLATRALSQAIGLSNALR